MPCVHVVSVPRCVIPSPLRAHETARHLCGFYYYLSKPSCRLLVYAYTVRSLLCQICLLAKELGNHEGRLGRGESSFWFCEKATRAGGPKSRVRHGAGTYCARRCSCPCERERPLQRNLLPGGCALLNASTKSPASRLLPAPVRARLLSTTARDCRQGGGQGTSLPLPRPVARFAFAPWCAYWRPYRCFFFRDDAQSSP